MLFSGFFAIFARKFELKNDKTYNLMKQFNDENFVLETKVAQDLYHHHAAKMPIIDYHCHLIPAMVANDHRFKSITELWLGGDHYKWRAICRWTGWFRSGRSPPSGSGP